MGPLKKKKRNIQHLLSVITGPSTPTRKCARGRDWRFKTTIVMSNNVAPSILWLVCAGGVGAGWGGGLGVGSQSGGALWCVCVKALIISALLVLVA